MQQGHFGTSVHLAAIIADAINPDGIGYITNTIARCCATNSARPHGPAVGGRVGADSDGSAADRSPPDYAGGCTAAADPVPDGDVADVA